MILFIHLLNTDRYNNNPRQAGDHIKYAVKQLPHQVHFSVAFGKILRGIT
jgi:hypothetical protein